MASTQPPPINGGTSTSAEQPLGAEIESTSTEATATAETMEANEREKEIAEMRAKWPGWPGYSVFRIVVPVLKVGGIIGRKGDLIKKLVEETRARVRVLDGPMASPDRIRDNNASKSYAVEITSVVAWLL